MKIVFGFLSGAFIVCAAWRASLGDWTIVLIHLVLALFALVLAFHEED